MRTVGPPVHRRISNSSSSDGIPGGSRPVLGCVIQLPDLLAQLFKAGVVALHRGDQLLDVFGLQPGLLLRAAFVGHEFSFRSGGPGRWR